MENTTESKTEVKTNDASNAMAGQENSVTLTAKAIEMIKRSIAEEGLSETHGLRVAVQGGGCSGLQYALDFANEARPGDSTFEVEGLKVYIDMASANYLKGTVIDYVSGLNGAGFKFENPNAQRSCGCGHSFS